MIGKRITERGGISVDENQIHHAIEQAYQLIVQAHRNMTDIWRTHVLFTRQWWFGVGLSICSWLFWIGFRDKRATGQFLLSGLTMIIVSSWLDQLGIAMGLWHYHCTGKSYRSCRPIFHGIFHFFPSRLCSYTSTSLAYIRCSKLSYLVDFPLLWPSRSHKWPIYTTPFTGNIHIRFLSMLGCTCWLQALPRRA